MVTMRWRWLMVTLLVAAVAGKGKKHRNQKPGRALFNRLASTPVSPLTEPGPALGGPPAGLLPAPLDAAPFSAVEANATCGERGEEDYCRQAPGKRGIVCGVCEGADGARARRHPAAHAADGDPATWWQSPTLVSGEEYRHVELVATLPDVMELLHVIIKSGPSPRPLAWSLEVSPSEESEEWRLIRAFGDKDHCRKLWDLRPERRRRKARSPKGVKRTNRAEKPTCSTQFSSPRPLENGEMHVAIGEGVSARRVKISFRAGQPVPAEQHYYTVRALTLAARCFCHGHADACEVDREGTRCACVHDTCGKHCQRRSCDEPVDVGAGGEVRGECSCGERGQCLYDDTGAIYCVNCTENRAGPLCDRCLPGFYNVVPDGPCLLCNCNPEGSDGTCIFSQKHHSPACSCNPGVTGLACDVCDDVTSAFPGCDITTHMCKCDPRGIVDPERVCDDVCVCKAHVIGERCDACAAGYFGLSAGAGEGGGEGGGAPAGCAPCYCLGGADHCVEDRSGGNDMALGLGEAAWLVADLDANQTVTPSLDEDGRPYLISYEVEGWEQFYWWSQTFSGPQLDLYGGVLHAQMYWGVVRGDAGGSPSEGPDFVIIGRDGRRLAHGSETHENPGQLDISTPLTEGSWYDLDNPGLMLDRKQLMDVLADVRTLMLRAHFHSDQDEVRLQSVEFRGAPIGVREVCSCGPSREGAHCERCASTHVRVPLLGPLAEGAPSFECVPCDCNGHAGCESVDGPCGPCQHNTTGPHCERCLPGHYGNPVQGGCKPCACPLYAASNNFSPNCVLAHADGDEFVCTQCPEGYAGDHCETCDIGYWGSPSTPGGSCVPCDCGGSPCDASGKCVECPPNTEGPSCEQCREGFYFDPSTPAPGPRGPRGCAPCACGGGALAGAGGACDARSGQCACAPGWTGRACDICEEGYGDITNNCPPCACGVAALSPACDPLSGACACAGGAGGAHCNQCADEHYGLSKQGCLGCNCSSLGAEGNACDIRSGQCRCKPHVIGRACDTCEEGYWGLRTGGCRRCACGAGAGACDPDSGACACAPGVSGPHCDQCMPGYYGFGASGCLPCPPCSEGRICDPITGRCGCPPKTRGGHCQHCATGHWGAAPDCNRCKCGPGARDGTCDPVTGQCQCRLGWAGRACDVCAPGHHGPRCRPCACHPPGSQGCDDGGVCPCDDDGQCVCKENVSGLKCTTCREGTFGLSAESPGGCTACFCFGRSAHCSQAGLSRAALHAARPRHVTLLGGQGLTGVDEDSLLAIHTEAQDATITVPHPAVPVYMELDKRFLGDKVTSYGGALRFKVEEEGGEELPQEVKARFPLVRIYGRGNIELDYYERVPPNNGTHMVRFHESLWSSGRSHASRGALMVALQRLQRVLVRVTSRAPVGDQKVHALLLNVSLDTAIPGPSRSAPALGVELCACPPGYAAPSCHQPAVGFYMPPSLPHFTNKGGTIVITLEEEARPCECNGRATECDPVTGDCLNCTSGTGGPRCEECAPGHLGSPNSPGGCQACPCPERTRNYAAACVFDGDILRCLCKPGYTGPSCASCAPGYHPQADGSCGACACDVTGAADYTCDAAGRCRCREFAVGDKCDQCREERTFMDVGECTACDNCSQTLLDSIEQLSSDFRRRSDINDLTKIPQPYFALNQYLDNVTRLRNDLDDIGDYRQDYRSFENDLKDLEHSSRGLLSTADDINKRIKMQDQGAYSLSLEGTTGLEEVLSHRGKIAEQVTTLDEFARGERHLSAHRALKEARHLLRNIKDVRVIDYIAGANDVFDSATLQSAAIQEYNYRIEDALTRLANLRQSLEALQAKTDDVPRLGDIVWDAGDTVGALKGAVKPKMVEVRDAGLKCALVLEDIKTLSARNLTQDTRDAILRVQTLAVAFPEYISGLNTLTLAAEEKEGILYNLTPTYREKYLKAVEDHVKTLGEKAKEYKNLFAGTRTAASSGVAAAEAWSSVVATLANASKAADEALARAIEAKQLARGAKPMIKAAEHAKVVSDTQRAKGEDVMKRAGELQTKLEHLRRGTERVGVTLRGLGWAERELASRPKAAISDAVAASAQADRVFSTTRALYDEASEVRRRVRYQLRRQLGELQKNGDSALGAAQEHVSQIRGNTLRAAEVAGALAAAAAARAQGHAAADAGLRPVTDSLKEKIAKARHAADSISVSLTSPPGLPLCSRSYSLPPSAPASTRLAIAISFDSIVIDGPLALIRGDPGYLKVFVEEKRVKVSWDLGEGEGMVTHQEKLEAAHDDSDHTSYRIDVERIWNTVKLTVERAGRSAVTSTNSSSSSAVSLQPRELWLGSEPGSTGLRACVHALYYDDRRVGLWNFVRQAKGAKCEGCTQRWYNPARSGEPSLAWFNGEGYAELRRSGLRPADRRQFSLALTFRTRDRDALLFMARDPDTNRSVSLMVQSCRVVFRVEYATSALQIAAAGRHCHGRPVHVQAIRLFANGKLERGSLRVNGEETLGSPSPPVLTPAALPSLATSPLWLGGAPPGAPAPAPPLLGCLGAVSVDRVGYDPLDTPARHGVEPRCGQRTLRTATLEGQGYIELPAPAFRRKAALGISFRARSRSGTVLLRAPAADDEERADDKHYLIIGLNDGELEVTIAAGKNELKLKTNGTKFDDGRLHSVRLMRAHKQLELWVDERRLASGTLAGNALPARGRGLFLGGAPGGKLGGMAGTVADFIVDGELIGLESALNWSGARLGRADRSGAGAVPAADDSRTRPEPGPLQAPPPPADCSKTPSYTVEPGAVKFGDAPSSHALLRLPPRTARDLAVTMQIRTFSKDGLLMLAPGSKAKPKHYAALLLRDGKLRLQVRGRRRRDLSLPAAAADGGWKTVSVRISGARLVLACGGAAATAKAPKKLGLAARLYVGGVPDRPSLPNVPDSLTSGVFVGCVRRVAVAGRAADLARALGSARGSQCFPAVEQGAHFSGDSHATWAAGWAYGAGGAGASSELRLQFRSAQRAGVLLAARGFVLELRDGALLLTRHSITGVPTTVEARSPAGPLCDGRWHDVVARLAPSVTLSLDAAPGGKGEGGGDEPPSPPMALFIGGVPDNLSEELAAGRENFIGCIRHVVVGGVNKDFTRMKLHNVLLDSCPVPQ